MHGHVSRRRKVTRSAFAASTIFVVTGCQQYRPKPIDLAEHERSLVRRATELEPLESFSSRLRAQGADAPSHFSLADGLSAAEAEVVALFHNPQLRLARLEAGIALADLRTAALWEDPVFGFDGAEILSPSGPFEFGLTASITIPVSGRLAVAEDRAEAAHAAALDRIVHEEWSTRAAVRRAWIDWHVASEQLEVLRERVGSVEEIVSITAALLRGGEISRIDARLFDVELAGRRAEIAAARAEVERRRLALLALIGFPAGAAVELSRGYTAPDASELSEEARYAALAARNTLLAWRRGQHEVAEEALRLEVQRQYPDVTIGTGYGNEDDDRLLLGVSLPVPILNANQAGIARARAERALAAAVVETTYEQLRHELAAAVAEHEALAAERAFLESDVLPLVEAQLHEARETAALGEVDTLVLLESVTRQFNARVRLLDLLRTEQHARLRIAELLGPASADGPAAAAPVSEEEDDS